MGRSANSDCAYASNGESCTYSFLLYLSRAERVPVGYDVVSDKCSGLEKGGAQREAIFANKISPGWGLIGF